MQRLQNPVKIFQNYHELQDQQLTFRDLSEVMKDSSYFNTEKNIVGFWLLLRNSDFDAKFDRIFRLISLLLILLAAYKCLDIVVMVYVCSETKFIAFEFRTWGAQIHYCFYYSVAQHSEVNKVNNFPLPNVRFNSRY